MDLSGSTALITGAGRGIGKSFAEELISRGAKVYATARNPERVDIPGAEVLGLDITDPASVAAAAASAQDVTFLINNAGVSTFENLVTGDLEKGRLEMETNYFGTLNMVRAFAPVLAANGGGAILNVLSVMSWLSLAGGSNTYAAAKAAEWSLTNGIRLELASQGTLVTGLAMASTDTEMMAGFDVEKNHPTDVARTALEGVETGKVEVLADGDTARVKASLSGDPGLFYAEALSTAE